MTAGKKSKYKRKKEGPPQTKGLEKQNPHGEEWREDPIVSEAHGIYFSL